MLLLLAATTITITTTTTIKAGSSGVITTMMTFIPQKSLNNGLMLLWVVWYRQVLLHALLTFTVVNNCYRPTHIHTGWSALARSPIIVLIDRGRILVQVEWCTVINSNKIIIVKFCNYLCMQASQYYLTFSSCRQK